jgi:outer membrane protein assembly factor BamB
LWRIPVGEGHAGAAIRNGCVYLVDYDREKQEDAIRCLSLDTGAEIWRYSYSVVVLRNHGMSRTVPSVDDRYLVAMGPKCNLTCLNSRTGELVWQHDLVKEYGTKVPLWYAAQCPFVENGRVIVAPGATPFIMALDLATGEVVWKTNVPDVTGMSHATIVPFDFQGRRQYVYLAREAVVGVAADTGELLWTHPTWHGLTAAVAGPVPVGDDRLFLCAGYGVGSIMLRLVAEGGAIHAEELYRLTEPQFGSEQHTPIFYKGDLYGAQPRPKGEMACMDLDGKRLWSSGTAARFEIGPYLIVNDLIVALDGGTGTLCLAKATPTGYNELVRAKVLAGHDAWAPMACVEGRLVLRDLTEMICVDLGGH